MNPENIKLVQESFARVTPIADQAAEMFYAQLFEYDPELRKLFKNDMREQGRKLMSTLAVVVKGLDNPDRIIPVAQDLAKRHVDYGVKAEDYTTVGNALLVTLRKGIGEEFTQDHREAWIEAYRLLAGVMKEAAYGSADAGSKRSAG